MLLLALDAGTTGITCLVYDDGRIIGRAYDEFEQHYPQPGWVEHDAQEIWTTAMRLAKAACRDAKVRPGDLDGIGITNQRETVVVWDRTTGMPVHRAIVWQDRRTAKACQALRGQEAMVRAKTGLRIDPYFSATKVKWILDEHDLHARAEAGGLAMGTIDAWLAWKLTGRHVTDPTNASRTLLWDIHESSWDDALCDLFGVPAAMLPELVPSSHLIGTCAALDGAPLCALVGDQQSALFGQGCTQPGQAKNTYGTGCFLLQHTGTTPVASRHGLLTTRAASFDDTPRYALEGSVFIGGAAIQWLRDGLGILADAPDVNVRATDVDGTGGVVVVPAFAGLGAPHWDPDARGAILGLTRGATADHLARATLAAIAHQCDDVMQAMAEDSGLAIEQLRVDGGAARSDLLMQMQADLTRCQVVRPADVEATARGAARLAAMALGGDLADPAQEARTFHPEASASDAQRRRARWQQAVAAVRAFKP